MIGPNVYNTYIYSTNEEKLKLDEATISLNTFNRNNNLLSYDGTHFIDYNNKILKDINLIDVNLLKIIKHPSISNFPVNQTQYIYRLYETIPLYSHQYNISLSYNIIGCYYNFYGFYSIRSLDIARSNTIKNKLFDIFNLITCTKNNQH